MRYAIVNGERTEPTPKTRGTCELCGSPAYAKCGSVIVWHWAHATLQDCDAWAERDSEWHREWQDLVPPDRQEVKRGNHRADIVTPDGYVVEIQHSYLPAEVIREREQHYGRMVWVFDAVEAVKAERLTFRWDDKGYFTYQWKHPRKTIAATEATVFLDVGDGSVFELKRIYSGRRLRGWGKFWTRADMAARFNCPAHLLMPA